jgi:hypothetical protein
LEIEFHNSFQLSWSNGIFSFFLLGFNHQLQIYWKGSFVSYLIFFIKLSQSHDLGHEFSMLAPIDLEFFCYFLLILFLRSHLWTLGWFGMLGFIIVLDLFFIGLFQFHDLGWGFSRLTRVNSFGFLSFIWFNIFFSILLLLLKWLGIELHNLF